MASETLRKVGWALIVVGLLDIGYMVYCIANGLNYASSFNLFAVIAGVFLLRQSLRAARFVAWFAAFLLAALTGAAILFPLLTPLDLWKVQLRLNPISISTTVLIGLAVLVFVFWVYRQLTSAPVMQARQSVGLDTKRPVRAFVVGAALAIGLFSLMVLTMRGSSADEAKRKAREQYGDSYRYHVTSMHWSDSGGSATLTAYNDFEIREVRVRW